MALDHYVSQVHLKKFYSKQLRKKCFYSIRKKNPERVFTTTARNVCRIDQNSTNEYLQPERGIENFLLHIEPKYNESIAALKNDDFLPEHIFVIAGFAAYVHCCSPTGMRLGKVMMKHAATAPLTAKKLEQRKRFDEFFTIKIDPKIPQAFAIKNIMDLVIGFYNCPWEILQNPFSKSPFFTSDFPIAIEHDLTTLLLNKIIPLTPKLAIKINTSLINKKSKDFSNFQYKYKTISFKELKYINRLIVQCAENQIFCSDNLPWVTKFVKKNAHYKLDIIPTQRNDLIKYEWKITSEHPG